MTEYSQKSVAYWMTEAPFILPLEGTLAQAWSLMQLHDVRHIPLCPNGTPAGLISEVDVANIDTWRGAVRMEDIPLSLFARRNKFTVGMHDTVADACEKLKQGRLTGVVVTDESQIKGIFTTTDALRALQFFYRKACCWSPAPQPLDPHLRTEANTAYTCGLLHDIGRFFMFELQASSFKDVEILSEETHPDILAAEQEATGRNHCEVGSEACRA